MRSYITSFNALFSKNISDAPAIDRIEIPLIQRDYAQGREGDAVERIRNSFLDVIYDAVIEGKSINLDFVYGEVDKGTLHPIDGQQRLTTLFLLHWFLASRADRLEQENGWKNFSYATRASARFFCMRLVRNRQIDKDQKISNWIEDQSWYQYPWHHDPTIKSMLVMLNAMQNRFDNTDEDTDYLAAWDRLVDCRSPAISFHLLPIEQMGKSDDLYITMNSRGKPLTSFEHFKAQFEKIIENSAPERVNEFSLKIDTKWADLLWPYRGDNSLVDDQFLSYIHYISEICDWREGGEGCKDINALAKRVYGSNNPNARMNLDFLIKSFDTWVGAHNIKSIFEDIFAADHFIRENGSDKVVIYDDQLDLFSLCCQSYQKEKFTDKNKFYLYAVILHRLHITQNFSRQLRILRNLVEASNNEIRPKKMPHLISDVEKIIIQGTLDDVTAFNQAQVSDEIKKAEVLKHNPNLKIEMFDLEDNMLLRGGLASFELDPTVFEKRSIAFKKLFESREFYLEITGALLSIGDYSRRLNTRFFQFGSCDNEMPWRDLFAGAARSNITKTREILGQLLDQISNSNCDILHKLISIQNRWLAAIENSNIYDWRYYFVKYSAMREGRSGKYVALNGTLGYSICMLNNPSLRGYYRDPYLLAIYRESDTKELVEDPKFTEGQPRRIRLIRSDIQLEVLPEGIALYPPLDPVHMKVFLRICALHGVGDNNLLRIPKVEDNGFYLDALDRVILGSRLLRDLVNEGL